MARESTSTPASATSVLLPIGKWVAGVFASFCFLAVGMGYLASSVPVESPGADMAIAAGLASTANGPTANGYPSTDFRLPSLDGPVLGPPDFLGKVVVAELWATWCGPCRLQARYLDQLHGEYGDRVQFLAIDVGEDEATVRRFVERSPFPYPVLLDPSESVQQRFRSTGLPTVMVIDPRGQVSYLNVGVADPATLRREIAKAQQSVPAQGTV